MIRSAVGWALIVAAWAAPALAQEASALPRVRVSADSQRFVVVGSGESFVPWGFNYLGKSDHLAEDDWETPEGWKKIEDDFRAMKGLGANVVRWHLQFETFMESADRPRAEPLARLKKLLALAHANGLYLDLTGLNCFRLKRIPAWYDALSEADRWKAQARFWGAIAETCAGDPAVFCYDLMNEPIIGEAKPEDHPWVGGELGGFHFVQRISNKPAGRENTAIAAAWIEAMVVAIREHDEATLITVGVIPWAQVWPGAKPIFYAPEGLKHLDFISVHFYPGAGKLEKDKDALAVYDLGKPLVVEEFFPLACSMDDLDKFVNATSDRVDGWVAHYFGITPDEYRAEDKLAGRIVADFLDYWKKKGSEMTSPR